MSVVDPAPIANVPSDVNVPVPSFDQTSASPPFVPVTISRSPSPSKSPKAIEVVSDEPND